MDVSTLSGLISNVGYPIVIGFVLLYFIKYQNDQHKEEMDKITEALNNNTAALVRLTSMMEDKQSE